MTDAPLEAVRQAFGGASKETSSSGWGAEERLTLSAEARPEGTHLRLDATLKGWGGFLRIPFFEWKVEHYLKRFVESL